MARFTAPADTSGIMLSTGYHAAENGIVEVPDPIGQGDSMGLAANGFVPAPAEEPKPKTAPARPAPEPEAE